MDQTQAHVESRYSDFQAVDGVLTAHRNEDYDLDKGILLSVNQITKRVINPDLPEGVFERSWNPVASEP